jgi:hypothetical protein
MTKVIWKRCKPDSDGVVWCDLLDPDANANGACWVITYRDYYESWHVMWNTLISDRPDHLISKTIPEKQLRDRLRLEYLLTRGG